MKCSKCGGIVEKNILPVETKTGRQRFYWICVNCGLPMKYCYCKNNPYSGTTSCKGLEEYI